MGLKCDELKAFNCVDSDLQEFCEPRLVYLKSEADKVIARHKYKRCLAMAKLCHWKMGVFIYKEEKSNFYHRWFKRWLKIADQLKGAK